MRLDLSPIHNFRYRRKLHAIKKRLLARGYESSKLDPGIPKTNIVMLALFRSLLWLFKACSFRDIEFSADAIKVLTEAADKNCAYMGAHVSYYEGFVLNEFLYKNEQLCQYDTVLVAEHLDVFPMRFFLKRIGIVFMYRTQKQITEKLMELELLLHMKQLQTSVLFFPQGSFTVTGFVHSIKLGYLRNLLLTGYQDFVLFKCQYTRIVGDRWFAHVRQRGWPKHIVDTLGRLCKNAWFLLKNKGPVQLMAIDYTIDLNEQHDLQKIGKHISYQLNALYTVGFNEIALLLFYNASFKQQALLLEDLLKSIIGCCKYNDIFYKHADDLHAASTQVRQLLSIFEVKHCNKLVSFTENNQQLLFHSINQFLYAFLVPLCQLNQRQLTSEELSYFALTPALWETTAKNSLDVAGWLQNIELAKFFASFGRHAPTSFKQHQYQWNFQQEKIYLP